jgi:hypothetical protein
MGNSCIFGSATVEQIFLFFWFGFLLKPCSVKYELGTNSVFALMQR